ncbi:MAG: hypothetical protein Q9207_001488 [Kuettlingeria erythrocarpa]
MSSKSQHAAKSPASTSVKASAIDFAASGAQANHHGVSREDRKQRPSHRSTLAPTSGGGVRDGSASDGASGEDADGLQTEGAEADSEGESNGDPDVHAPSDPLFVPGKGQTGLDQGSHPESTSGSNFRLRSKQTQKPTTLIRSPKHEIASDDDDYNGVDLISESGDEEPAVEQIEEKAIVDSEEDNTGCALPLSPPNSPSFSLSSADFRITEFEINPWPADDPFFAEQINLISQGDFAKNTDNYGHYGVLDYAAELEDVPRRRVHFAEPLMVPSENEETASLDSRHATTAWARGDVGKSRANDGKNFERNKRSFEGSQGDETPFEGFGTEDNDDSRGSVGSSSGYETDQGETTDEEDVPASATTRPSALLRYSGSEFNNRLARQPLPKAPSSKLPPGHRWGPTLGSWVADPTKPIAVVASSGKQLIVYPAQRPTSKGGKVFPTIASCSKSSPQMGPRTPTSQLTAPFYHAAMDESEVGRSEISNQGTARPMLGASPNLMMSGLGLGSGNLFSGHALGPPEAFFPFHSIGADGSMVFGGLNAADDDDDDGDDGDDGDDDDGDDDEGENILKLEDFIDFGRDSEESDQGGGSNSESFQSPKVGLSDQTDTDATPTASPSAQSSSPNFYHHLNRGKVTAFRRNQYDNDFGVYRSSSTSSIQVPNPIKSNAFVAASSFGALKKRKLSDDFASDEFGPSMANSLVFAKRRAVEPY